MLWACLHLHLFSGERVHGFGGPMGVCTPSVVGTQMINARNRPVLPVVEVIDINQIMMTLYYELNYYKV